MKTIGFIGLGIMGKPMSRNLLKAGHTLIVYDINAAAVAELAAAGARTAANPKEVAAQSDLVEPLAKFFPRLVKMAPAGERAED